MTFVNTIDKHREFLPKLLTMNKWVLQAFCDLEGKDLGKPPGTVSLFQLTLAHLGHTWIFHITKLGKQVFTMMETQGQSIRGLLESGEYLIGWWGCRSDANALWFHYEIKLHPRGTYDIQMMELATREGPRDRRHDLDKVVGVEGVKKAYMTEKAAAEWPSVKFQAKATSAITLKAMASLTSVLCQILRWNTLEEILHICTCSLMFTACE
jgi:hypothetical protein